MATSSRRSGAPTVKRQAIEADVLRATESLLAGGERFADLAVERIATEAGLSRTAFYFYFSDKRDLLMRLSEDVMSELYAAADEWWTGGGALAAALDRISELYRRHGPLIRAVVEVAAVDAQVGAFWRELIGRFITATQGHLESERDAGRLPEGADPAAMAFALVWMTERSLHESIAQDDPVDPARLVESLQRIWDASLSSR